MSFFNNLFSSLDAFIDSGGPVLKAILLISICLWCLIAERLLFFKLNYPLIKQDWLNQWLTREDRNSVYAHHIRTYIISQATLSMSKTLPVIKMIISICPLLGLLGTVTGMIHVFDILAVTGTGNARAMASGISRATIPTMAGMVISIAGMYFHKLIEEKVNDETHQLADLLKFH